MDKKNIRSMWVADQGDGTYRNPILYTDYSDPDVIRVGDDYFMVASSFCNAPSVPLLHSKDLVNWKVINYVMEKLPFERYDRPMHGCGAWAPAIRCHNAVYYVLIPFPDEGILMCCTKDPWGKWSEPSFVKKACGWIDPCPFWDDDGKAYMVNAFAKSRIGFKSMLYISEMDPECKEILEDGKFVYDGHETQPTIEGPKLYKRNGWYYIFAPAGGVATGWQTVLRSRNIYGPYEERIVMCQGNSTVNGPHQGGWVETQTGESWFVHFQDVGNAGRVIHLQPMYWEDDWPVIGEDSDHTGCGTPVVQHKKPDVGAEYPVCSPVESDFFEEKCLGLQWQWNANPKKDWYEMTGRGLLLYAQKKQDGECICDMPNLLLQKWPAPEFQITTCMKLSDMEEGDVCGLVSFGGKYAAICVAKKNGNQELQLWEGERETQTETCRKLQILPEKLDRIYFRMQVKESEKISFLVSRDENFFIPVGEEMMTSPGKWVGVKAGLVAWNESSDGCRGGNVTFDYFVFEALGK